MKDLNNLFDGIALPDDLLEQIVGGMSQEAEDTLRTAITLLKAKGTTMDRTLEIFAKTDDPELREETLAYIKANWDLL